MQGAQEVQTVEKVHKKCQSFASQNCLTSTITKRFRRLFHLYRQAAAVLLFFPWQSLFKLKYLLWTADFSRSFSSLHAVPMPIYFVVIRKYNTELLADCMPQGSAYEHMHVFTYTKFIPFFKRLGSYGASKLCGILKQEMHHISYGKDQCKTKLMVDSDVHPEFFKSL